MGSSMTIVLGIAIVGWIIVLIRPSYTLAWFLGAVVLAASTALAALPAPQTIFYALGAATAQALGFVFIAAILVSFRGDQSAARGGKTLDKEMERIRAEIAARDGQPPGAS
jgi:hypothetical protein